MVVSDIDVSDNYTVEVDEQLVVRKQKVLQEYCMKVSKCTTLSWIINTIISSKMMKQPSAQWTALNKRALVSILLVETNGRYSNLTKDKSGWNRVVASLVSKTGFNYTHAMDRFAL